MINNCLFCQLVQGELPSHQAFADPHVSVILPRKPVHPGHVMVVTNEHIESFFQADDELYTHMMLISKRMAQAINAVFTPLQVVMETSGIGNRHVHVHVIPVYGLYDLIPQEVMQQQEAQPAAPDDALAHVADTLRRSLASLYP